LALADLSASETKKVTVKDLIQHGVALIDPSSIPADKVNFTLPAGSVGTTELADHAVTAIKLADDSSGIVRAGLPAAGAFIGQLTVNTTDNKAYIWDGAAWHPFKAAASVNGLTYNNTLGPIGLAGIATGDSVELAAVPKDTTAGGLFMAGPAGAGGTVDYRAIAGSDLPAATAVAKGAVQVSGDGLRMAGSRIEIDNDVTPPAAGLYQIVAYDAKGLVSDGKAIDAGDLPLATTTTPGIVMPGSDLTVQPTGQLDHEQKVPGGGTYSKITFNGTGHVTAGTTLGEGDIPDLPASKITNGAFSSDRIGDRTVTADKLADYALAYIQENVPPSGVGSHPIGMTWLQESTGQVSVWNGNSWMKTGASTLFNKNLRYAGTYNAATGVIAGVTQFGTAEGFKIGDLIPAADDKIAGIYFVASTPGASSSLAGGAVFDAGDWLLCHGTTGGWVRIDTLSGAGGGGGGSSASHLDDLLDVTLTAVAADQLLVSTAGGQWVNKSVASSVPNASQTAKGIIQLATQVEVDAGTDALKAVTAATLKEAIVRQAGAATASGVAPTAPVTGQIWTDTSKSPPALNIWDGTGWVVPTPPDATTTVKGVVELATVAEAEAGTDTVRAVTPAGLKSAIVKVSGGASGTAPTSPSIGQVWTDTSKAPPVMQIWDGTKWVAVGAAPADATTTVKGIIQLATAAEVLAGTDLTKAITPKEAKDHYIAKNISTLPALP
jgi:hypothetical protein